MAMVAGHCDDQPAPVHDDRQSPAIARGPWRAVERRRLRRRGIPEAWRLNRLRKGEIIETRELVEVGEHGPAHRVGKVSLGAIRDSRISDRFTLGAGGLVEVNFVPDDLASVYGGHDPVGAMAFATLWLD